MNIEGLKKHFGYLDNTGTRILVVFRKIPNDEKSALVVSLDSLPDSWRDEIINAANSQAGQATVDFYTTLQNRNFPDGSNALNGLHQRGFLKKVPVAQVIMTPITGQKVPLGLINASIDKTMDQYLAETKDKKDSNVVEENIPLSPEIQPIDPKVLATGLITEAELLEKSAEAKREEAYLLAPELRPGRGRPTLSEEEKEKVLQERKEKRRLRDQRNAAAAKLEKKANALDLKVEQKMKRDANRKPPVETVSD
jgi:hypothetical protein